MENINGDVKIVNISYEDLLKYDNYHISNIRHIGEKLELRIITEKNIGRSVYPRLEDVYMYYYNEDDKI